MAYRKETLVTSTIWKLLERFSSQAVSFVVTIILARILIPEEYGIIAILMVFINLANVIVDGGLNTALVQKKNADNIDFSTIFLFCMGLACILYLILYFCAIPISRFYSNDLLVPVLRILSLNLFFNSFNAIQRAYVSRNMLFKKLFYSNLISVIISGIIGILLAYNGFGVWALVAQQLIGQLVISIVLCFAVKWKPTFVFSFDRFKGLFDYGWKIFLSNIIIAIYEDIRSVFIGKIYQPATLAYYDRGKQFPSLVMTNINTSLQTILLPAFADIQDDRLRVKEVMRKSMKVTNFCVIPLLVGLIVAAKPLVLFILTEKWLPAVPFMQIFCVAFILMPIQSSNICAIKALGYSGITLKIELMKKVIEAIILIVSFCINVYAVAVGVVIYNLICVIINLYPNKKLLNYGLVEQISDVLPILLCSALMGMFVFWIQLLPIPIFCVLILQFLAGAILYIMLSRLFKIDSLGYVVSMIKAIIN